MRKSNTLFYEFEETGLKRPLALMPEVIGFGR
jgi:hypothetical protein